jgi:hypothetical protein
MLVGVAPIIPNLALYHGLHYMEIMSQVIYPVAGSGETILDPIW